MNHTKELERIFSGENSKPFWNAVRVLASARGRKQESKQPLLFV